MNMKKLVALLLALVMVFALCACGGDKDNGGKDSAAHKVAMIRRRQHAGPYRHGREGR